MSRWLPKAILGALALALAFWLDPWAWRHLSYRGVYDHDWGRLLRVTGSLLPWAALALAFRLEAPASAARRSWRPWMLLASPAGAGAAAELLKLLVRRERPDLHEGAYVYRAFAERLLDTHDLGFPSSHVAVAFAGAATLGAFYPRAGMVAFALAAGCAVTRVLSQAHFASDAVAGALAGWALGSWLGRRTQRHAPEAG